MIQTADQYVFLYQTLIEGILTRDASIALKEYMMTGKLHMDIRSQYKVRKKERKTIIFVFFCNSFWNNYNQLLNFHIEVHLILLM